MEALPLAEISCCGNSVCPPMAAALVEANCGYLAVGQNAEHDRKEGAA